MKVNTLESTPEVRDAGRPEPPIMSADGVKDGEKTNLY